MWSAFVNAKVGYLIIPGQIRSAPNGRFNIKSQTYMVEMAKTTRTGRKKVLVDFSTDYYCSSSAHVDMMCIHCVKTAVICTSYSLKMCFKR